VRLKPARAEENVNALAAKGLDAPAERDPARERRIHERQHHDAPIAS
jgi:hypothetical protein